MSADFHARVELAARETPASSTLTGLGAALTSTGHTALGWVELHLTVTAAGLGHAAGDAIARVESVVPDVPVLAVEVLSCQEAATRAGIVPSPATIGVPAAEILGITEQAVRHRLRTGRLARRREGRDWRFQRAEVDRARAARAIQRGGAASPPCSRMSVQVRPCGHDFRDGYGRVA